MFQNLFTQEEGFTYQKILILLLKKFCNQTPQLLKLNL